MPGPYQIEASLASIGAMPQLTRVLFTVPGGGGTHAALANEITAVDTTSGSGIVDLPDAPAASTLNAVKQIVLGTGNMVTVTCQGSDVINKSGGGTTQSLTLTSQGSLLHYNGAGIWTVLSDDLPLSQLQALFAPLASPALTGTPTAPTATPGDTSTQLATDAFVAAAVTAATAQAEYNALYRNAVLDGFAAWTMDPWPASLSPTATTLQYPSGVLILYLFYLPISITINGYFDTVWRGAAGFSNGYIGLYSLSGSTATLLGTGYNVTLTSHSPLRGSLGLSTLTLAAGYYAIGQLIGTQGGTAVGPIFANAFGSGGVATRSTQSSPSYGRVLQCGSGLSALPSSQSLSGATENQYLAYYAID